MFINIFQLIIMWIGYPALAWIAGRNWAKVRFLKDENEFMKGLLRRIHTKDEPS